jgi:hypothetical protein
LHIETKFGSTNNIGSINYTALAEENESEVLAARPRDSDSSSSSSISDETASPIVKGHISPDDIIEGETVNL